MTLSAYMAVAATEDRALLNPNNYSSWLKLRRIQSWINRFLGNCQKHKTERTSGELEADELKKAEI
ncbi:MAG: hypothetical protein N0E48_19790, partial [Candidatus Thiodiazotropha endolucinida]|nr:hypothetical protein [Candidatus Thiodiazotropha taylori]MCW4345579.1 hypothetical protein [Candidatus Thiodiazotropha endolucinida]